MRGCSFLDIWYVYQETNNIVDWVASFVVEHSDGVLWTNAQSASLSFYDVLFFEFYGCIHTKLV